MLAAKSQRKLKDPKKSLFFKGFSVYHKSFGKFNGFGPRTRNPFRPKTFKSRNFKRNQKYFSQFFRRRLFYISVLLLKKKSLMITSAGRRRLLFSQYTRSLSPSRRHFLFRRGVRGLVKVSGALQLHRRPDSDKTVFKRFYFFRKRFVSPGLYRPAARLPARKLVKRTPLLGGRSQRVLYRRGRFFTRSRVSLRLYRAFRAFAHWPIKSYSFNSLKSNGLAFDPAIVQALLRTQFSAIIGSNTNYSRFYHRSPRIFTPAYIFKYLLRPHRVRSVLRVAPVTRQIRRNFFRVFELFRRFPNSSTIKSRLFKNFGLQGLRLFYALAHRDLRVSYRVRRFMRRRRNRSLAKFSKAQTSWSNRFFLHRLSRPGRRLLGSPTTAIRSQWFSIKKQKRRRTQNKFYLLKHYDFYRKTLRSSARFRKSRRRAILGREASRPLKLSRRRIGSLLPFFVRRLKFRRFRRFRRLFFRKRRIVPIRKTRFRRRRLYRFLPKFFRSKRFVYLYFRKTVNNVFYSIMSRRRRVLANYSNGRTEFLGSKRMSTVACESAAKTLSAYLHANKTKAVFFVLGSRFNHFVRAVIKVFRSRKLKIAGIKYHMRKPHSAGLRPRASRRV